MKCIMSYIILLLLWADNKKREMYAYRNTSGSLANTDGLETRKTFCNKNNGEFLKCVGYVIINKLGR
jgi:hypothetical protein